MAHAHSHSDPAAGELTSSRSTRRVLTVAVAVVALATVVGLVVLWPREQAPASGAAFDFGIEQADATVVTTDLAPCQGTDPALAIRCQVVDIEITSGSTKGETARFELAIDSTSVVMRTGNDIVVAYNPDAPLEHLRYAFVDYQRKRPLAVLAGVFVLSVLALGRLQGVRALLGLALTLVVVFAFLLPALLEGRSPLPTSLVAAGAVALIALYLTHGVNQRTTVALLGTFASLALTGVLGAVFVAATKITGLAEETAINLAAFGPQVDIKGLVLAGIVIGSLGVLDDVTVTQVASVSELHAANPSYGARELYRSAVRIGRDHIASTVNTLVLAYAGAALPLLLLYSQADRALLDVANGEVIAVEIVRTLVGSIGLVASVPITTALAAAVVGGGWQWARPASAERPAASAPSADTEAPPSWDDFSPGDEP